MSADARGSTVLYVSPLPPPAGGIATWTRILVRRGLPGGLRPVIVNTAAGPGREVFQRASLGAEAWRAARVLGGFVRALVRERPRFVHVNVDPVSPGFARDALCAQMARWAGIPVAIHYRGQVAGLSEHPEGGFQRRTVARAARRVDLNLVLNDASAEMLRELAGPEARIVKVPNYFDDESLPRVEPPRRGAGERLQVVYAGGLTRVKGIPEILETAGRMPDCDFHLLGRHYPETQAELAGAPGNVVVHGEVEHAEVVSRMRASHVLLFPSRHNEGFPNAVCEAMALGLPGVVSRAGAIPEMIDDEAGGFLCEPDADALVPALQRLEADESLRHAMGQHNSDKAWREYSYPGVMERLLSLYASCEGSSGR